MIDYLDTVENITLGTSKQPHLLATIKVINEFKKDIGSSDAPRADQLVKKLRDNLAKIEYTWNCVEMKTKALADIKQSCIDGNKDLDLIYNEYVESNAINSGNCTNTVSLILLKFLSKKLKVKLRLKDYSKINSC